MNFLSHTRTRYPAYVTSAGWLGLSHTLDDHPCPCGACPITEAPLLSFSGYSDEKIARLTREAVQAGFNHFKMKVGADRADDLRRGKLIRSIIDDPQYLPDGQAPRDPRSPALAGKNAGPTGAVLMIDANQVWDVQEAIDYVASLEAIKPWCAHMPLSPGPCGN